MSTREEQTVIANGNCNLDDDIASSTKDVFEGQVLIDRLLLYYSKFEGSRERAARYAQKLLDMGHVESLTNGITFEDSAHVYRWADANTVVNEAKSKTVKHRTNKAPITAVTRRHDNIHRSRQTEEIGKAVLKISIETDNCQAAEIQANIKASPRSKNENQHKPTSMEPNTVTTVEEDSFFGRRITKTLSYLNDGKNDVENRTTSSHVTDVSTPLNGSDSTLLTKSEALRGPGENERCYGKTESSEIQNGSFKSNESTKKSLLSSEHQMASSPRKNLFSQDSSPLETKRALKSIAQGHRASLLSRKSATEPIIAKEFSPGPGAQSVKNNNGFNEERRRNEASYLHESNLTNDKNLLERNEENLIDRATSNARHKNTPMTLIASTQTSEKSILEASMIYNAYETHNGQGKRSPSPAPRRRTLSEGKNQEAKSSSEEVSWEQRRSETKAKELQRVNHEKQERRARFETSMVTETAIASDQLNSTTMREQSDVTNGREILLHSSGNADEIDDHELATEYEGETNPPISPPPPSPSVRFAPSPSPSISPMKSLFWTKISNYDMIKKSRKVFWDEAVDELLIDEEEFEKLFSKPPPSPQTHRMKKGEFSETGKMLKVLGMERSRQVSIRASSVRLPVEDIHDAIVNMDDEKLNVDALQVLCDVRPSPEELDQIADALKARPNAILDKPEQFVLMLAMIPSLDERLRCWIFAKKFPDKIVDIQEQLLSLNDVCLQVMQSTTLKKILELVLLLGNMMNRGSQRGEAYGYYLDILPKLKDVKSKGGNTNLLEYTVKVLRQQMKLEGTLDEQQLTPRGKDTCGLPELELLHRSISVSLSDLGDELESQAIELRHCKENLLPAVMKESTIPAESETFQLKFEEFLEKATAKLRVQAQLYQDVLLTIEEFHHYYIPNSEVYSKEAVFTMLRSITDFSVDFRQQWMAAQKEDIKEEFYKIRKYRKERQAEIQIKNTPSALKERFLSRQRQSSSESHTPSAKAKERPHSEMNGYHHHHHPPSRGGTPIPKRNYKFEETSSRHTVATPNGKHEDMEADTLRHEDASIVDRATANSMRIEKRMQELHTKLLQSNKT